MSGICPNMNGAKCATNYCEFWNNDEQTCTTALESHKRVEILNLLLGKVEEVVNNAKSKEQLLEIIKEFNIVSPVSTIQ